MQLFSADATIYCFAPENMKKNHPHNRPKTFFSVLARLPKPQNRNPIPSKAPGVGLGI